MARRKNTIPRSERVRERRKKGKRMGAAGKKRRYESAVREMPPVMVRGSLLRPAVKPKTRRKSKRVKRRYDIPLEAPGTEIRLSMPVVKVGWRLLSLFLTVGLVACLYFMWTSPTFQVQAAEVNGAHSLTATDINRTLNATNKPVFTLDPGQLEEALKVTYPEIIAVSVRIGLPATVFVEISERVPLIAWNQDSVVQWVDGDGFAFPPRGQADQLISVQAYASPPAPPQFEVEEESIEVLSTSKVFMFPEMVTAILTLRSQAPEGTQLVYDRDYGMGWTDARGWDVFFGSDLSDYDLKLRVYQAIVDRLVADGITPALINVEHVHAPYYRLER